MNASFGSLGVAAVLAAFSLFEDPLGIYRKVNRRPVGDLLLEYLSLAVLAVVTTPAIKWVVSEILQFSWSARHGALENTALFFAVPFCLLTEDILQYTYHRAAHHFPGLWKLHRAHHSAESMGVIVAYRNGIFYYVFMPNFWWNGVLIFLGLGKAVAISLILKQLIVVSSHSKYRWDRWLYRQRFLASLTLLLERFIVTPSFHHCHHGRSESDGVSHPNGNFGNLFSMWDVWFGTAKISRKFPDSIGIEHGPKENWATEFLFPVKRSELPGSELGRRKGAKFLKQ